MPEGGCGPPYPVFPKELTDLVGEQHGVYALYKGNRLYYVGLATHVRNRIKLHLRDKHAGKWDKSSLYLIRKTYHIKELESLILRTANPMGNATKGRLLHAENLKSDLHAQIKQAQEKQLVELLGRKRREQKKGKVRTKTGKKIQKGPKVRRQPTLAPYVTKRFSIQAKHKGNTYKARVRSNGRKYYNGVVYTSPNMAGRSAIGRSVDG